MNVIINNGCRSGTGTAALWPLQCGTYRSTFVRVPRTYTADTNTVHVFYVGCSSDLAKHISSSKQHELKSPRFANDWGNWIGMAKYGVCKNSGNLYSTTGEVRNSCRTQQLSDSTVNGSELQKHATFLECPPNGENSETRALQRGSG